MSIREHHGERPGCSANKPLTIAVIGDVHDLWEEADEVSLERLGVDLALFVGDFGNEAVDLVRRIANLRLPKAAIMGNHDAWYSATEWGRKKCPYDRRHEDWVKQQLDLLGAAHVGYDKLDLPELGLAIVGGRPFSWGGSTWKNEDFYQTWYGVSNFEDSTERIVKAARSTRHDTLIFLGHCGPKGLGSAPEDLCGKDWQPIGGDHGDPDLAEAIVQARHSGKTIPLVAFGHMHHQLRHTKTRLRKMIEVDPQGTVYLNAASVPRIQRTEAGTIRNFSLVTMVAGVVTKVALVWVDQNFTIQSESVLYQQPQSAIPEAIASNLLSHS